jgi:hypothetical protein
MAMVLKAPLEVIVGGDPWEVALARSVKPDIRNYKLAADWKEILREKVSAKCYGGRHGAPKISWIDVRCITVVCSIGSTKPKENA